MKRELSRKLIGIVLGLLFAGSAIISAAPAHAVSKVTRAASCYLSPNWKVNVSVTWYDNDPQYVVITSPGKLNSNEDPVSVHPPGTFSPSQATASKPLSGGSATYNGFFDRVPSTDGSAYTYRANITGAVTYQTVTVSARTGATAECVKIFGR